MAADGKNKIVINMKINPFGEFKGAKPPDWFKAREKEMAKVKELEIKRTMMLAPKWKKKVLEQGIYAVARYELARFATALNSMQKDIDKAIPPKERKTKKFTSDTKKESKEVGAALTNAEKKVTKLWNKISAQILSKIDDALDEVEADKGDNAKAIARGKAALAKFKTLKIDGIYKEISTDVVKVMGPLAAAVKANQEDKQAWGDAEKGIKACIADFAGDTKTAQDVVKFLLDTGAGMKKNKDANEKMQKLGERILNSKKVLEELSDTVDTFEEELKTLMSEVKAAKMTADQIKNRARKFVKDNAGKDAPTKKAFSEVSKIGDQYAAAVKAVK
ncbi:MAG: hypothetical protein ABJX32_05030 [Tateyamaria sp.]|uniref:hypothetical protein n=1 Tax=Tateyamaria sp. TaxID=1929288 RepID=UPI00329E0367